MWLVVEDVVGDEAVTRRDGADATVETRTGDATETMRRGGRTGCKVDSADEDGERRAPVGGCGLQVADFAKEWILTHCAACS